MSTPCRYKIALHNLVRSLIDPEVPHSLFTESKAKALALLKTDGPCNPPDSFEVWWATPPKSNEVHPNEICDSREGALVKRIAKAAWDAANVHAEACYARVHPSTKPKDIE